MNKYIQIEFQHISSNLSDLLIAALDQVGFDGFEEGENSLLAYIKSDNFNEQFLKNIADNLNVAFTLSVIEETNWNAVWESNFQPVIVDDFVGIRADFHKPIDNVEHEIIITPKMSFGTGHHATTYMMIQQMREIDFNGKSVLDFGTGTGVLSILADKLGASDVLAIDNDHWSIENAIENFNRNDCKKVQVLKTDNTDLDKSFHIILANINKNVILSNLPALFGQLNASGVLVLSGLLLEDETDILEALSKYSSKRIIKKERNNWICLRISN